MTQPQLNFDSPAIASDADFSGAEYEADRDMARLSSQLGRIWCIVKDGKWRTLEQLQQDVNFVWGRFDPLPSISAQLRNLRKPKFGGYRVERRHVGGGLFEYRLC